MAYLLPLRVSFEGKSSPKNFETSFSSPSCLSEGFDRMEEEEEKKKEKKEKKEKGKMCNGV